MILLVILISNLLSLPIISYVFMQTPTILQNNCFQLISSCGLDSDFVTGNSMPFLKDLSIDQIWDQSAILSQWTLEKKPSQLPFIWPLVKRMEFSDHEWKQDILPWSCLVP